MKEIDTSNRGWQREFFNCMSSREEFALVTEDEALAKALEEGQFRARDLTGVLFGGTPLVAGAGMAAAASGVLLSRLKSKRSRTADIPLFLSMGKPDGTEKWQILAVGLVALGVGVCTK